MTILLKMTLVLSLMIFLLKRKTQFGHAMLASTLLLFIITKPALSVLSFSLEKTFTKPGTWFMLITLYLVMCLEYLLRTSGILKDFTASARKLFGSDRVLLGFMPAFLGFLPSLGGAIFSAPLVQEAGARYRLSPEKLSAINYWFRHIWEFSNPILPAILLASELAKIPVGTIISNQFIFCILGALIGIFVLLTGKSYRNHNNESMPPNTEVKTTYTQEEHCEFYKQEDSSTAIHPELSNKQNKNINIKTALRSILLAAGPIFLNLLLVIFFDMNTALALGLVLSGMIIILRLNARQLKDMFVSSFDGYMHWGVLNIIFFQQMLENTGSINQIVSVFENSGIPVGAIIGITAFIIGLLVGSPQGFVAVTFPLITALTPGNLDVIALSYLTGCFGTMTSPAHLCQIVTLQYFKADFFKTLLSIVLMEILLLIFGLGYVYFF